MIDCEETDYDHRGDCDGPVRWYWLREHRLGKMKGEKVALCGSHARMGGSHKEIGKKP